MARFGWIGAALAVAIAASGCGGPPPSAAAAGGRANVVRGGRRPLEIVPVPRSDSAVAEVMRAGAMIQAGLDTVAIQITEPKPGEQADAVREAIRRDPPALIVEAPAAEDAELDAAVAEARAKGLLVLALGRALGGDSAGAGREIVIASAAFEASADRIVELAVRNAANGKLDPKAGALVVVHPAADPGVGDRVEALKNALSAAGVVKVEELPIGDHAMVAMNAVAKAVKDRPEITIVLAADGSSLAAADDATGILKTDHRFVVAGYTDNESNAKVQTTIGEYAATGIHAHDRLFRKAIYLAARALRGEEPADDRVEIAVNVLESPPSAALPKVRAEPPGQ